MKRTHAHTDWVPTTISTGVTVPSHLNVITARQSFRPCRDRPHFPDVMSRLLIDSGVKWQSRGVSPGQTNSSANVLMSYPTLSLTDKGDSWTEQGCASAGSVNSGKKGKNILLKEVARL